MLTLEQVRRLKEVLRATSAPLSFESFSDFARAVLTPLIDLVGGHGGNLFITDVKANQKPLFLWHTYDPELVTEYQGRFFEESPIRLMVPKGVRVGQTCEYVDYEQFQKTAFYNEFLAPRRIHHMATLMARLPEQGRNEGSLGILGLHRNRAQEAFSAEELEILDLLYNPVEGALHTLLLAGNDRQALEQAFHAMPVGVLVLNWKLERVYANPALEGTLDGQELLASELAGVQSIARRTRDLYLSRTAEEPDTPEPFAIHRGVRSLQIRATVLPEGLMSARPHLLCLFEEREILRAKPNRSQVQAAFGLTDREGEVVFHCLMGLTNAQIAHEMGIAPETVKHHLKNVFEKTGVSRRSQLAALLPGIDIPRSGD
jgi:DNA-binding CsgD family transcriptional regulator/PAS domain-containing protein